MVAKARRETRQRIPTTYSVSRGQVLLQHGTVCKPGAGMCVTDVLGRARCDRVGERAEQRVCGYENGM
jgi:hypothetical protein